VQHTERSVLWCINGEKNTAVVPIDDLRLLEDRIDLADARRSAETKKK
jgi:hypothetical protein